MADEDNTTTTSSQEAHIRQFKRITGVDEERAVFFLQSAAWNLDAAVGAFYDDTSYDDTSDHSSPTIQGSDPNLQLEPTSSKSSSNATSFQPPAQHGRGGIATLSDYKEKPASSAGGEDHGQHFFAGGSEHSGQMIEGPPRKKADKESMAKQVFEAAKKQGAVSVEEEERERERTRAFQGAGFRLGDAEGPSALVSNQPLPPKPETVRHTLIFWKDGFSVDDGPLRTGDSPEDKTFIDAVRKGEIPGELRHASHGGEVDVDINDKREESYVRSKPKIVAFSGEGRKLGSYAPEVKTSAPPSTGASGGTTSAEAPPPPPRVPLDPDQPTTSIQIRLADGTRLVAKFNHSHTVNDVRQFINMSRPSSAHYVLMTTFPNKELSDPTLSLSQANLLNAVIVQRIR